MYKPWIIDKQHRVNLNSGCLTISQIVKHWTMYTQLYSQYTHRIPRFCSCPSRAWRPARLLDFIYFPDDSFKWHVLDSGWLEFPKQLCWPFVRGVTPNYWFQRLRSAASATEWLENPLQTLTWRQIRATRKLAKAGEFEMVQKTQLEKSPLKLERSPLKFEKSI